MLTTTELAEQAQAKIDVDISALEERIRVLRSSRNTFTLIYRLPAEIMTEIFLWLQLFLCEGSAYNHRGAALVQWSVATCVSQHWRSIALSSKILWATIPMHKGRYAQVAAERSGLVTLTLLDVADPYWFGRAASSELVISLLPRTRSLHLVSPFLALDLSSSTFEAPGLNDLTASDVRVSSSLLSNSLRSLKLSSCEFEWQHLRLPQITSLTLSLATSKRQRRISAHNFLVLLRTMPQLSHLEIDQILRREGGDDDSGDLPFPSYATPGIQTLTMREDLLPALDFIPYIKLSASYTLKIEVDPHGGHGASHPASVTRFIGCLGRLLLDAGTDSRRINELEVLYAASRLQIFGSDLSDGPDKPFKFVDVNLATGTPLLLDDAREIQGFPLQYVEGMRISAVIESQLWPTLDLPQLRRLVLLNGGASSAFLQYLVEENAIAMASGGLGGLPFPSLKEIELCDIQYGRELKAKVQSVLGRRMNHGKKLGQLSFIDSSVSDDAFRQLSKVVDNVSVRGTATRKKSSRR
ncbi:hypothetical protein BDN72DRAFT_130077 [Pluteus cervinus]|uniref:Uncharacterized protein n=1 Tax=Pluteus cervinus TaxID=181527 RepID=A0ACD3AM31_9AGAR|nr:hypothetical protein BDN72DRAFT_130077 [Pluteus cervinus]